MAITRRRIHARISLALIVAIMVSAITPPQAQMGVSAAEAAHSTWLLDVVETAEFLPSPAVSLAQTPGVFQNPWGLLSAESKPAFADETPPLSVSRVQSAYTPGGVFSGTLVVTYTVANNQLPAAIPSLSGAATLTDTVAILQAMDTPGDANTLRNVLLADTLTGGAVFASSSLAPDRNPSPGGDELAWNLGDIPPMKSITVTMAITVPASIAGVTALDGGATAWGTRQSQVVNASACPVTLTPDTLSGEPMADYLRSAVDADPSDEYVSRFAGSLCTPNQAFEAVRTLGYEAYRGSLRGARGTLWSQAGNSLDKSSLLIATLRANGTPARYQHGTLSDERARELILSMFPTTGGVVGYVPEGATVSDPANDPDLLAEARDHWWVEAYQNGQWVAMDPSFSYAAPGATFTTPGGAPLAEPPNDLRHTVTFRLEIERYQILNYLMSGFEYQTTLVFTMTTAELVGQPVTVKHLVSTQYPPAGCLIYCWVHYSYVPYLQIGDGIAPPLGSPPGSVLPSEENGGSGGWVILGHPYFELLSNYPLGQFAVTGEWLHLDVRDAEGNLRTYTRTLADRVGIEQRESPNKIQGLIPELTTEEVISRFGPQAPPTATSLDNVSVYFNPSWMSAEYAAHVGENLLAAAPRVLAIQPVISGLADIERIFSGERPDVSGRIQLAEAAEVVEDTTQAFNRMMGASFVTMSDAASQDLAQTGLVKVYPDAPRITIASFVIAQPFEYPQVITQSIPTESIDLLSDGVRAIAYPGQAKRAEPVYRLTRGMNEAFLEKMIGDYFIKAGEPEDGETAVVVKSAAGVLQAAGAQNIPLIYVDEDHLQPLAQAAISEEAKARIVQTVKGGGYGVLVPKRMATYNGEAAIAWWQVDLRTGETVGVGEEGMHQFLVQLPFEMEFFFQTANFLDLALSTFISYLRHYVWEQTAIVTWKEFWYAATLLRRRPGETNLVFYQRVLKETKTYMNTIVWGQLKEDWEEIFGDEIPVDIIR